MHVGIFLNSRIVRGDNRRRHENHVSSSFRRCLIEFCVILCLRNVSFIKISILAAVTASQ